MSTTDRFILQDAPSPTGGSLVRTTFGADDVTYLMREVTPRFVDVEEKERLIQGGAAHYGQLLSPESAPRPQYAELFERTLREGAADLAGLVTGLAGRVVRDVRTRRGEPGPVVVVSLARGGTPVGALVARALRGVFGQDARHYGVSIIRDHGIDEAALDLIRAAHPDGGVVFVDGWTGKGVIAAELRRSVTAYNAARSAALAPDLYVLSDPAGRAAACATREDVLIPNAMLGATVAGLVSRTLLPDRPGELHGAAFLPHLAEHDVTRRFLDTVGAALPTHAPDDLPPPRPAAEARVHAERFLRLVQQRFGSRPLHHIKPGVGEATRVLLRRAPELLLLRDHARPDVRHLVELAGQRGVPVHVLGADMPYGACALIRSVDLDP